MFTYPRGGFRGVYRVPRNPVDLEKKRFFLGGVCFFRCKRSVVCEPRLQTSAREEVDQMSAECNKESV
ncbi:hypothetical protein Hanom_Chr00s003982g01717261 [Helianthus anomalus]